MSTTSDMQRRAAEVATELAHRAANGIDVLLLWDKEQNRLRVAVDDTRTGESFELVAASGREALDLFYHPFAYAGGRRTAPRARPLPRIEPAAGTSSLR